MCSRIIKVRKCESQHKGKEEVLFYKIYIFYVKLRKFIKICFKLAYIHKKGKYVRGILMQRRNSRFVSRKLSLLLLPEIVLRN